MYIPMMLGNAITIARPFLFMAALLLFAGSGYAASSCLALNENGHTLNTVFPSIMGIVNIRRN